MKLKLQYDTFEEGEFTEELNVNLEELLQVFEKNTAIIKSKRSFTISKPYISFFIQNGENYLRLAHIGKDSFIVSYCNDPDDKLYQATFYKKSVQEIIILFCQDKHDALCKRIPRTKEHEKKLIEMFKTKDFVYHYKHRGIFNLVFCSVLYFSAAFLFLCFLFSLYPFSLIALFPLLMVLFFLVLIVLIYRLHFNHIHKSKNKIIQVRSGSQKVVVTDSNTIFEFEKKDVAEVICLRNTGSKNAFNGYSFSTIKLKDNRSFNISFMIIDFEQLQNVLKGVSTRIEEKTYPFIKD